MQQGFFAERLKIPGYKKQATYNSKGMQKL